MENDHGTKTKSDSQGTNEKLHFCKNQSTPIKFQKFEFLEKVQITINEIWSKKFKKPIEKLFPFRSDDVINFFIQNFKEKSLHLDT